MARFPSPTQRPFLYLGLLAGTWLLLPPVFRSILRASFFELHAPALAASSYVRDVQEFWALRVRPKAEIIAAGVEVARANAAYQLRLRENELLRLEIGRLEEILRLPSPPGYRYEVARVERREVSAWWQQLVIRKGRNYGIPEGAPVVFAGGVVGRVREVGALSAVVDLVSSPEVRLAAALEGDPRPLRFAGGLNEPFQPPAGRADFIPADVAIPAGQTRRLLTSGLGGVFPGGLVIGSIELLEPDGDGVFQHATVLLDARLSGLREVAVLVPDARAAN